MVLIGCCEWRDVAVSVLATVVSHQRVPPLRLDAGALSLSKDWTDPLGLETAFGAVKDHPELTVASVSQEHGVIRAPHGRDRREVQGGAAVEIITQSLCLTERISMSTW